MNTVPRDRRNPPYSRVCKLGAILTAVSLSLAGCTGYPERSGDGADRPACHIVYDAGSSSTRLFVYQRTPTGWQGHRGPVSGALADPVRGNRGKTIEDADAVVDAIVMALEKLRRDGPPDSDGQPEWRAFDWQRQCRVESVSVYATAGMRIAEQQDPQASRRLWKMLNEKLSVAVQKEVTARTLTGFEEGLFAWLAKREEQGGSHFGLVEMGGASMQVTFPCSECEKSRQVRVKGQDLQIYSHSLLGWGQDEAWKKLGHISACQAGSGKANPDWTIEDCATGMSGFAQASAGVSNNIEAAGDLRWYLTAAFRFMKATDVDDYCRQGIVSSFEPDSACFRAVYLQSVLDNLGLSAGYEKSDVSWTLGAVVCTDTRCLETD